MKKILSLIAVLILGIASVSIVMAPFDPCEYVPPSECQGCWTDFLVGQCFIDYPDDPLKRQVCIDEGRLAAFLTWQDEWFHPYWMEIYSNGVKGCYARDLLCFNRLNLPAVYPDACSEICGDDIDCQFECGCYIYGGQLYYIYRGGAEIEPLVLTVPSCTDSRTFFSNPPPCAILNGDKGNGNNNHIEKYPPCCIDLRGCGNNPSPECATPCSGYDLPPNYICDVNEYVIMGIDGGADGKVLINGVLYDYNQCGDGTPCILWIVWYNGEKPFEPSNEVAMISGVPRTITIEGEGFIKFTLEQKCCYDCTPKPQLPATILYPKVDIETFSVPGGATVISNGKLLSAFQMPPGSQQVFLQVENRGFFTQNDSRVRFDGLPDGVTVEVTPETQKITAHNLGTYSANFTVGPNVPSGTYQVTMVAYSPRGVFDKITFEFVVP